ncbi:hypothetical protein V8C37DRAFT_416123 [Trichoderma ceciliae]
MANVDAFGLTSPALAAAELQTRITNAVRVVPFPPRLNVNNNAIINAINTHIDAKNFHTHNLNLHIVEVDAIFTAKTRDGQEKFRLLVRWDADTPPNVANDQASKPSTSTKPPKSNKPTKPTKPEQTSHYGWEIELGNGRVAGPGHVFFIDDFVLPHYRQPGFTKMEAIEQRLTKTYDLGNSFTIHGETRYYENHVPPPVMKGLEHHVPSTSRSSK